MVDTFIGSYATEATDVAKLVGMKAAGNVINVSTNKFANSLSAGGAAGDIYRRNSSSNIERVAIGATGYLLGVSGGLPGWLAGGPVLISSTTVSSPVSSVSFTNIPASGYTAFMLVGHNVESAVAATTDTMLVQVSTDNGSTWKTTSGDYYQGGTAGNRLTTIVVSGSTSTFKAGSFAALYFGLGNSSRATVSSLLRNHYGISATNIPVAVIGSATGADHTRAVKEADNAIRIISNGGSNIAGGTFQLYGVTE